MDRHCLRDCARCPRPYPEGICINKQKILIKEKASFECRRCTYPAWGLLPGWALAAPAPSGPKEEALGLLGLQ